jgi:hypothetical protein
MKNDFSKPILKVGQLWKNGHGEKVRIVGQNSDPKLPFDGDGKLTYTPYGRWTTITRSKFDLVEMIEDEHGNPVTQDTAAPIPTPENYKRIDHEDGRIEFVPIEKKKQEEYFDFGNIYEISTSSDPFFILARLAIDGFECKELMVMNSYKLEVVEEDGFTRLRFKRKV